MASRRMKIKTMAKLPSSRSRPVDRPKTPSLMSPGPYGEPPSPSTNLFSPTPSFPLPPSSPKPSSSFPNCPPSPKPPVVYHIYPPPSPKYNTYDDSGGPVPSPSNVLSVSSAGLLSPRTPQSHHNTPVPSPMPPSPIPSSYVHTGTMSPRRPTTPKTPLSFHGDSDRENSQDSFINPPTPIYFSSYSALSPGMGPGIPSSRAPPSISPGPSTSNPSLVPEDLGGKSAFASLSRPFNTIGVNNSSSSNNNSGGGDIKPTTTSNRTKVIKTEMTSPSSSLSLALVPRPSTPTTTITTIVPYNSSPSKYNTTSQNPTSSSSNTDKDNNKDSSSTHTSSSTVAVHHHHHHHQPHVSNAPNNTDTLRQRLQKGSIAPTTSKYAMIRKEYISKYQNKSPNPKDLTILHYAFFNPPKFEKPPDESLEDEDAIFDEDTEMDKDKTKTLETPKIKKKQSSTPASIPTPTTTAPPPTPSTDSSLKEINEAEKKQSIAPKVKIGPDGQLIIDEQSLVIETSEAKRAKEQLAQMETVSGSTYAVGSSGIYYRKKPFKRGTDWTEKETLKFYRALISCGTDFSMMESVFKHRTRSELKAKFKREDRRNQEQVSRALQKQVFDPSFALTDSEDEKEQDEQVEQIIGKVKGSKKRKSIEKEGGSIEKISKNNISSNNDNVVSTEIKTKDGKKRKPRRKSAAIAPSVKKFVVKNPKNGKVDWDLSRSIEQESIDKQQQQQTPISSNSVDNISMTSNNLTIQKNIQVESTNIVTNNNNNNRTNHEIMSKNVLIVEGDSNTDIVSDNITKSQTIKNINIEIIKNKNTNRNKNIDTSNTNSNIDNIQNNNSSNTNSNIIDSINNNNSSNSSSNNDTNKKPTNKTQTTRRKRNNSTSISAPKPKKSKKETNKRVCTLIQPKKPARKSTRKKSTSEDKDSNNQSKVLPQIFRFDAEDPLGLKIVKGITNLSMPSLEKESTSTTATTTTTTLSTVHTKEFKSTIQSTSSTSDIISSDSNSGKSYITLVPSTRKLRKSSLNNKSQSESVRQKDQPSSSHATTIDQRNSNIIGSAPQNPLPIAANKKTSLKRKGTPYRLPGPGPGTFPAPATTLVDEIEIEITCK